ncbi:hypothetical protein ACTPOK_22245 [Streptomyces inhibens]|uniref:hypothetical protein n=1 Tax=Streptomyces inhibens TaxID=2293571 RepID=UPI00402AA9EA
MPAARWPLFGEDRLPALVELLHRAQAAADAGGRDEGRDTDEKARHRHRPEQLENTPLLSCPG